jgi:hypothetical protein
MDEYLLLMSSALKAAYGLQNLLEGSVDPNIDSYSKEMLPLEVSSGGKSMRLRLFLNLASSAPLNIFGSSLFLLSHHLTIIGKQHILCMTYSLRHHMLHIWKHKFLMVSV